MAEIAKKANWIKRDRALAWQAEQARREAKRKARTIRNSWKARKAEQIGILPAQAKSFNPIRGLRKVA